MCWAKIVNREAKIFWTKDLFSNPKRHDFLEFLLSTIEKQSHLENALLVISTDISNPEVEKVISKIEFMNHVHIVFPNSAQFYSGEFPATTPNDCFPLKQEEAKAKKCLNYPWPDTFGNYRFGKVWFSVFWIFIGKPRFPISNITGGGNSTLSISFSILKN